MKKTTQRSLEWCRKQGWLAEPVERWIQFQKKDRMGRTGTRRDLFNFADLLALDGAPGVHFIQPCAGARVADAVAKMRDNPKAREAVEQALAAGNRVTVHGWRKVKPKLKDGSRGAPRWAVRLVSIESRNGSLVGTESTCKGESE